MSHNSSRFLAKVKNSSYILTRKYNEFLIMYILSTVHTTPLPTGEGLGVGLCGASFLPSNPRLRVQAVLHFTQLELKDIILCHRAQTLACRHFLTTLHSHRAQIAIY
mgnify:FL=1